MNSERTRDRRIKRYRTRQKWVYRRHLALRYYGRFI
jgi:hypothetical protein